MAFGLVMVWMHPHQACLSSLDEAVRKLTLLIDLGDNWAYTFVQLNKNTQYIPLSLFLETTKVTGEKNVALGGA